MKKTLLILLTSILAVGSVSAQVAQRVTKIIVGYPAGGGTDALARSLAQSLAAKWDQTVLVENKVGAAGALASEYVSKAAGDGLTLLFTDAAPIVILPNLKPEMTAIVGRLAPIAVAGRQTPALAILWMKPISSQQFCAHPRLSFAPSESIALSAHLLHGCQQVHGKR